MPANELRPLLLAPIILPVLFACRVIGDPSPTVPPPSWSLSVSVGEDLIIVADRKHTQNSVFEDPGTTQPPWNYSIDWGDGSARATGAVTKQGALPETSHTYDRPGVYTLSVTVTDIRGATGTGSRSMTVAANRAPIAAINGPYASTEGSTISFSSERSTDPNGDELTYQWTFGDGTTSTSSSPMHAYADDGTYKVTLVVTDPSGAGHNATITATIANVAPTGTFMSPATVNGGAAYSLAIADATDVAPDQPGLEYRFDCGSGFSAWASASSITCGAVGGPVTRAVHGAVRDKDRGVRELSGSVEILGMPPSVSLAGPADGESFTAPATITLSATASDVDGNLSRVEFYNGATLLGSDATAPYTIKWSPVPVGSYVLTARAVDEAGTTSTSAHARVTVTNLPPVANPGGPYTGTEGVPVTVDGGGSTDPEAAPLTYAWSFGDATTATGRSTTKTFTDNGTYTITLVVSDPLGASHSATTTATIANAAPTGRFSTPTTVFEGSAYTISMSGSDDGARDRTSLEYAFDCGRGYGAWSAGDRVSCPAQLDDSLDPTTVRGKLRDKDRAEAEYTAPIQVRNAAPEPTLVAMTPTMISVGQTVRFQGEFTDPGVNDGPWFWRIVWGDNTPSAKGETTAQGSLGTVEHTYMKAATYEAYLSVEDKDRKDGSSWKITIIVVEP